MKIKSALMTEASGSIGGMTASRNKGGLYLRARSVPTNPQTPQQIAVRNALSTMVSRWSSTLTQAERDRWTALADLMYFTNPFGDQRLITPLNLYVRENTIRQQASEALLDDAAAVNPFLSDPGIWSIDSFDAANDQIDLAFTSAPWVSTDGAFATIAVSRPISPTVNFFKGPYRFAAVVLGDATTPPTSPVTVTCPFAFVDGQKLAIQVRVVTPTELASTPFRLSGISA